MWGGLVSYRRENVRKARVIFLTMPTDIVGHTHLCSIASMSLAAEAFFKVVRQGIWRAKCAAKFLHFNDIHGHDVINAWMYACAKRPTQPHPSFLLGYLYE
jgi:catechol-2,3-dioxygenase